MLSGNETAENIILLIFDTLRSDALSCYAGTNETPAFERVARQGTLFERAYAAGPGTPISHAALFSGQYPSTSGVVDQTEIPDDVPLMAEQFSERGYDTFRIPGPVRMGSQWGYDRGFDTYYEVHTDDHPRQDTPEYFKRILTDPEYRKYLIKDLWKTLTEGPDSYTSFKFDLIKHQITNQLSEPFFVMMNTVLAHSPYDSPRPYMEEATPELDRPPLHMLEYLKDGDPRINKEGIRPERIYHAQTTDGIAKYLSDPSYLTSAELDFLRKWYDACVQCLDDRLDFFLDWFEDSEYAENTILVITADHGEHFGEHDLLVHSHGLFKENLHVPLLMKGPGIPSGKRYQDFASLVDVFDTVCDVTHNEMPTETDGNSLFSEETRNSVYAEHGVRHTERRAHRKYMTDKQLIDFGLGRKSVRDDDYLYVYRSDGTEKIYEQPDEELIENPDEDICQIMRGKVAETLGETFQSAYGEDFEMSEGVRSNLEKLGYI